MCPSLLDNDPPTPVAFSTRERATRRTALDSDPAIENVSMPTLVGIAKAIENEAVRRYALLAQQMDRRGEPATAAAFRVMLEEERSHAAAVDRWAAEVGEPVPEAEQFEWRLPADLSSSWDEISASALLTPYRAFAVAVENEQRAFSFYAYLAANAGNARVRAEAEKLGAEELRHAALLRRWRRRAYHQQRRPATVPDLRIASVEVLHGILAHHEAAIATSHRALARRLRHAGDEESAQLLERLLEAPTQPPAAAADLDPDGATLASDESVSDAASPGHLLLEAQRPLEVLSETLESIMMSTEGKLFDEAANAMTNVITRMARISLQSGRMESR